MQNWLFSKAAAQVSVRISNAVPDRRRAATIERRLRTYLPIWELASEPDILAALLAAAHDEEPYWWRPARVALRAVSVRCHLSGLDAAEAWLLEEALHPTQDPVDESERAISDLLTKRLICDTRQALALLDGSEGSNVTGVADEPEGMLICLYDLSLRITSRRAVLVWLSELARQRPSTGAKVILLNEPAIDSAEIAHEVLNELDRSQSVAFVDALSGSGGREVAAQLSIDLTNHLQTGAKSPDMGCHLTEARFSQFVRHWERGMAARPGDPARAIRELTQAWESGRLLIASISLNLGRLHHERSDNQAALAAFRQGLVFSPGNKDLRVATSQLLNDLGCHGEALEMAASTTPGEDVPDLALQRARALSGLGDTERAIELSKHVADSASTPTQRRDLATLLFTCGTYETAAIHLEQAVEAAPDQSAWFAELGDIYAAQSRWSDAKDCYQQWFALEPVNTDAMLKVCLALRNLNQLPAALQVIEQAVRLASQNPALLIEWLTVAHESQEWGTAVQAGQAALAVAPDSSRVHLRLGQAYGFLQDTTNATFHLRRATQLPITDGDPSEPWLALADLIEAQGDPAQTELVLKEGLRALGETSHTLLVRLGSFYQNNGRPTEAHASYWQAYQAGDRSCTMLTQFGKVLSKLGHQEQAVERLEEAAQQAEATGETFFHLSKALQQTGRGAEAVAAACQAARLLPDDGQVLLDAGRLCLAHGDVSAVVHLEKATSHYPDKAEVWESLGQSHQIAGNWRLAADALWTALRLDPANPHLQHQIGVASFNLGEHETAITVLKEAAERLPRDISVKESLAAVLEHVGWWQEATQARQEAAELAPRDPERLLAWARTARQAGDLTAAEEAVVRAQQVVPNSRSLTLERALVQKASGDRAGALRTLRELVRDCPDPLLLWQVGDSLIDLGQPEEGLAAFSRAADTRSDDPEAQVRLAEASLAVGNHQQALAAYETAAQLEPENPRHQIAIGSVQWEREKYAQAAQAWGRALASAPGDLTVMERLAYAYARMGDPAAALEIFEDVASRSNPEDPSFWQASREAGRAALTLGELDRSRSFLSKALKRAPTDPETYSLIGALADQLEKGQEALDAYRRAAELAPDERAYQLQLVDALTKSGHNLDAVNVWERLMDEADDIDEAAAMLAQMGKLYARAGRYDDAERVLRTALQQMPDDQSLRIQLAGVLVERSERADYQADAGLAMCDFRSDLQEVLGWLEASESPKARRDLARGLLLLGRVHEAISGLNSYLANIRSDLSAQRALGVAYRRAKSYEASIDVLSTAQRLAPSDERTAVELAKSYLATNDPQTALTLLDRLTRHGPKSSVILRYLAQALESTGERAAAIEALSGAVQQTPTAGQWHRLLSEWLRGLGQASRALPHAQACVRYAPGTLSEVELAQTLTELGQAEEAIPHWQAALKAEPENSQWWREIGNLLLQVGQAESAVKSFEYAGRLAPDDVSIHVNWAEALLAMGRIDEAGSHAQRAVALTPHHPAARAALGRWQATKGAWQDALTSFQTAVLWASDDASGISPPERAGYLLEVARAYLTLGAAGQALQQLERAVELAPDFGAAYVLMGDLYSEQGQDDLARQAYQQAAHVAPHDTGHLLRLARFLQNEGQLDQALDWLMKAISARPAASLWLEVARVYEQRDQRGKQLDALLKAVELEPESSQAYFELGVLYKQRKDYQQAIEAFEKATKMDPNNTEAHKQLSAVLAISLASRIGSGRQLVGMDG